MLEDISINSKQSMAEISNQIYMNKTSLKKLSKSELINLLLKQEKKPKIIIEDDTKPVPARKRPIPTPRKSVKDMVQQYEDNIIIPPPEFRDDYKPIPLPRTKKPLQAPIPAPRTKKPVPEKRTIISQVEKALKGYTKSFDVELRDKKDPLLQLQKSRRAVEYLFNNLLVQTKGFKFVETLQVKFLKQSNDKNILKNGYFNSITDLIINETDIKLAIQASQQQILNKIAQWISEGTLSYQHETSGKMVIAGYPKSRNSGNRKPRPETYFYFYFYDGTYGPPYGILRPAMTIKVNSQKTRYKSIYAYIF